MLNQLPIITIIHIACQESMLAGFCEQLTLSRYNHSSLFECLPCCVVAGMHELAESGGAAHAAYKGGLDALQANRLQAWTRTLRALPPALSSSDYQPQEWSNQAAAAEQLFRCHSSTQSFVGSFIHSIVHAFTHS